MRSALVACPIPLALLLTFSPVALSQEVSQALPGRLLFYRLGRLMLISPDGKVEKQISKTRGECVPSQARLSPDGKRVAYLIEVSGGERAEGRDPRRKVYVRGLDEPEPGADLGIEVHQLIGWTPDGSHLIAVEYVYGDGPAVVKLVNLLVNVKTRKKEALKLPDNHAVQDWSRDDKVLLTTAYDLKKTPGTARLYLMKRGGTEVKALTDGSESVYSGRLSPDGGRLLYLAPDPERKGKDRNRALFVLDIQNGRSMRVEQQPRQCDFLGFCWSPDGKRIAYVWRQDHEKKDADEDTESALIVADSDGRNSVTIASEKAANPVLITVMGVDWR